MASLTLKNVPDELIRALREAAEGDRRSLNQEIMHLLASALGVRFEKPAPRAPEVEAQVAAWRKLAGRWDSDADPASEAEQLTQRRTPGREVDL